MKAERLAVIAIALLAMPNLGFAPSQKLISILGDGSIATSASSAPLPRNMCLWAMQTN